MKRKCEERDVKEIKQLIDLLENRCFDEETFQRIYMKQLNDESYACFVYEHDGKILGCLNMRMEEQLHHCSKVAQILEFCVSEESRSEGIGRQLFQYALSYAKENGCEQIELETSLWRKRAHAFYEREGMIFDHAYYTMKL